MNRKTIIWIIVAFLIWLLFALVAHWVLSCDFFIATNGKESNSNGYIDYMNAFYVALGALFTGLAFFITLHNLSQHKDELQKQNERIGKQISLDVFTDAFGHVLDNDDFREAKKYVYSYQFKEDIDTLVSLFSPIIRKRIVDCRNRFEKTLRDIQSRQDDKESIDKKIDEERIEYAHQLSEIRKIDEYKKVLAQLSIEDFRKIRTPDQNKPKYKRRKNSIGTKNNIVLYERIKYFCDRMEYLGIIHFTYYTIDSGVTNNENNLIIDYFGYDIISTYEILKSFIQSSLKDKANGEKSMGNVYYYYTKLYYCAKDREKVRLIEMKNEMRHLSLKESNNQQIK